MKARDILLLTVAVAIYSLSGYFSKSASQHAFLTVGYVARLSGVVAALGVYAVLWQVALSRVDLSRAYPFKSLGLGLGLAIAHCAFGETLTAANLAGFAIVVAGLLVLSTDRKPCS